MNQSMTIEDQMESNEATHASGATSKAMKQKSVPTTFSMLR